MEHDHFIEQLADDRVLAAIAAAGARSTARIALVVSRRQTKDAIASARRHYRTLKLNRAPHRNGVLIFVAPRSQNFSIFADSGALAVAHQTFWDRLRDELAEGFKQGRFTGALTDVITQIGDVLAERFPKPSQKS